MLGAPGWGKVDPAGTLPLYTDLACRAETASQSDFVSSSSAIAPVPAEFGGPAHVEARVPSTSLLGCSNTGWPAADDGLRNEAQIGR